MISEIKVPTKWEEVTLNLFLKLVEVYDNKGEIIDILEVLTNVSKRDLKLLPMDIIDKIMAHLLFMNIPLKAEPDNKININGDEYKINYMEKLKFLEFVDSETALKNKDYVTMLAILCRKEGEIYDDDFIADKLDLRTKMFENLPVTEAFILINFFLKLNLQSRLYSPKYLEISKDQVRLLLKLIKNSVKAGDGGIFSTLLLMIKLRKLEKLLKSI